MHGQLHIRTVQILGADGFSDYSQSLQLPVAALVYIIYESRSKETLKNEKHFEILPCAPVGTASHRHCLEACSVFG